MTNMSKGSMAMNPAAQQMMADFMSGGQSIAMPQSDIVTKTPKGKPLTLKSFNENVARMPSTLLRPWTNGGSVKDNVTEMKSNFKNDVGLEHFMRTFGGNNVDVQRAGQPIQNSAPKLNWATLLNSLPE